MTRRWYCWHCTLPGIEMTRDYTIALFAACIAPLRITDLPSSAEFTGAVALAVSSVLFAQAGVEAGHEAISGDRVGYMGDALSDHGWVYVAGVEIAAEIPLERHIEFLGRRS